MKADNSVSLVQNLEAQKPLNSPVKTGTWPLISMCLKPESQSVREGGGEETDADAVLF